MYNYEIKSAACKFYKDEENQFWLASIHDAKVKSKNPKVKNLTPSCFRKVSTDYTIFNYVECRSWISWE